MTVLNIQPVDRLDYIMRYEAADMVTNREVLALFSDLVQTGAAWSLQGSYGRQAQALIDAGYLDEQGRVSPKGCAMLDTEEPLDRPCSEAGCGLPAVVTRPWGTPCAGHARLSAGDPGAAYAPNH
jgi:hypothetical protein